MSTATYLSALAFSCTSLLVVAPAGGEAAGEAGEGDDACRLAAVEAELALAREPDLYLVLDVGASRLEAAVRGVRFDPVPAALEVGARAEEEAEGREAREQPEPPAVHRVEQPMPDLTGRARPSVGAPPTDSGTSRETTAGPPDPSADASAPGATPVAIPLEGGGTLELRASPPSGRGAEPTPDEPADATTPGHLVLTLPADALLRVRHRLRPGIALLVLGGCGPPRPENR